MLCRLKTDRSNTTGRFEFPFSSQDACQFAPASTEFCRGTGPNGFFPVRLALLFTLAAFYTPPTGCGAFGQPCLPPSPYHGGRVNIRCRHGLSGCPKTLANVQNNPYPPLLQPSRSSAGTSAAPQRRRRVRFLFLSLSLPSFSLSLFLSRFTYTLFVRPVCAPVTAASYTTAAVYMYTVFFWGVCLTRVCVRQTSGLPRSDAKTPQEPRYRAESGSDPHGVRPAKAASQNKILNINA